MTFLWWEKGCQAAILSGGVLELVGKKMDWPTPLFWSYQMLGKIIISLRQGFLIPGSVDRPGQGGGGVLKLNKHMCAFVFHWHGT